MEKLVFILIIAFSQASYGETSFINEIPDFTQTNVVGENSGNGQQYCAPTAVSNSIVWLSDNESSQLETIKKLASKQYMNTSLKDGTGTSGVLRGVDKISKELFGGYQELEYEGWRSHPKMYSNGVRVPDIKRMKSYLSSASTAWINVGWYKYSKKNNEYQRIGGHWVTLVGYNRNQLILHDPAPRAGKKFSNEYVNYSEIKNGTLVGKKIGLPTSAQGYFKLGQGMHIKSNADFAIIDGVVYFKL